MDNPPSDGNEPGSDIFILSNDEPGALLLKEILEQKNYRVCVFNSVAQLNETIHTEKPDLLICDSTTGDQEGVLVCSRFKADNDLLVIPVLVLTAASTIGDLLRVIESNADNFIAQPYNLPDNLALIEGMLSTPVERQTPDQVKKSFKVRHHDKTYVVTAGRRKLLEYLLSAFEIAVNKSQEIGAANAALQEKEQRIVALTREYEGLEKALLQKAGEIANLEKAREDNKTLIASHDENLHAMVREREDLLSAHRLETDRLTTQVSTLRAESDTRKTSLDTIEHALRGETARSASLEEKFKALLLEYEQQKSAYAAEKNRALSAEQEIIALTQGKSQSEKELARIITDLDENAKQQAAELARLKGEIEAETRRRVQAETVVISLQREAEQSGLSNQSVIDSLNRSVSNLQEQLTVSAKDLEKEKKATASQQEHLEAVIAELEKNKAMVESLSTRLSGAEVTIASGEQERQSLADNFLEANRKVEKSVQTITTLSADLDKVKSALEAERVQRRTVEETLERTNLERENAFSALRQEYEGIQADLDSHKVTLAERLRDIEATKAVRVTLEGELEGVTNRNRELEDELARAGQYRDQSGQQLHTLSDDLEQVKAALETERGLRRTSEEKINAAAGQQEVLEQRLRTAQEEIERAKKEFAGITRQFEEKLDTAGNQVSSLETHAGNLAREKLHAEQEIRSLTAELEKVRNSLADERRSHMGVDEGHAAAYERPLVQQPLFKPCEVRDEKEAVQMVIITEPDLPVPVTAAAQPVTTGQSEPDEQSPISRNEMVPGKSSGDMPRVFSGLIPTVAGISGADNIFLEPKPVEKTLVPVIGTENEKSPREYSPGKSPSDDDRQGLPGPGNELQPEKKAVVDTAASGLQEGAGEQPGGAGVPVPGGDISFNRKQWLDLIRWAHHCDALPEEGRFRIIRMGRLIQKDRKLTNRQQDQVREILASAYALGYRT